METWQGATAEVRTAAGGAALLLLVVQRGGELRLQLLQRMHLQLVVVLVLRPRHQGQAIVVGITTHARGGAAAREIGGHRRGGGSGASRPHSCQSLLLEMRPGERLAEVIRGRRSLVEVVQLRGGAVDDRSLVRVAFHEQIIRRGGTHGGGVVLPQTGGVQGVTAIGAAVLPTASNSATDGWNLQVSKLVASEALGVIDQIRIVASISRGSRGRDETGGGGQDAATVVVSLIGIGKVRQPRWLLYGIRAARIMTGMRSSPPAAALPLQGAGLDHTAIDYVGHSSVGYDHATDAPVPRGRLRLVRDGVLVIDGGYHLHVIGRLAVHIRLPLDPQQEAHNHPQGEDNQGHQGGTQAHNLATAQRGHAGGSHAHMQREVGLGHARSVLGHAVELTGVRLLGIGQHQLGPLLEPAFDLLEHVYPLVGREGGIVRQEPPIPVPIDVGHRYRSGAAGDRGILTHGGLHVVGNGQHFRSAGKLIHMQIGKGAIDDPLGAAGADGRHRIWDVALHQPELRVPQPAVAEPGIVVQLDAMQPAQGLDGLRQQLAQLVPIQTEQGQSLEATEGLGGNGLDVAVRQIQLVQRRCVAKGLALDLVYVVGGQGELPQRRDEAQGQAGHGHQEIVGEIQLHQVRQTLEGLTLDLADLAVAQIQLLQVEEVGADELLVGQGLQLVPGHVQYLGIGIDVLWDLDQLPIDALHRLLAALPLAGAHRLAGAQLLGRRIQIGAQGVVDRRWVVLLIVAILRHRLAVRYGVHLVLGRLRGTTGCC